MNYSKIKNCSKTLSSGEGNPRWYLHAICQDWHQGSGVVCLKDLIKIEDCQILTTEKTY